MKTHCCRDIVVIIVKLESLIYVRNPLHTCIIHVMFVHGCVAVSVYGCVAVLVS